MREKEDITKANIAEKYTEIVTHPFRETIEHMEDVEKNKEIAESYFKIVRELANMFHAFVKNMDDYEIIKEDWFDYYHDFLSTITICSAVYYWLVKDDYDNLPIKNIKSKAQDIETIQERLPEQEKYLTIIEKYLLCGEIEFLMMWKRGVFIRKERNFETREFETTNIMDENRSGNIEYILEHNIFPTAKVVKDEPVEEYMSKRNIRRIENGE